MPPRMDLYLRFSRMLNEMYAEYTNLVESYGIDEDWLDVTAEFTWDVHLYYEDNNQWFMERR